MALSNSIDSTTGEKTMTLGVATPITLTYVNGDLTVTRGSGLAYDVRDRSNFDRFVTDLYVAFDEETA